jgi:phage-related protein
MGVQIKPASKIKYMEDGTIKVFTNNMTNDYKTKNNLDYILYDMGNTFYLFRNSDYMVVPNTNGGQVIHYKDPAKIYKG